jgi:hypothetical protein
MFLCAFLSQNIRLIARADHVMFFEKRLFAQERRKRFQIALVITAIHRRIPESHFLDRPLKNPPMVHKKVVLHALRLFQLVQLLVFLLFDRSNIIVLIEIPHTL